MLGRREVVAWLAVSMHLYGAEPFTELPHVVPFQRSSLAARRGYETWRRP